MTQERKCAWCGEVFTAGSHNAKFCGSKCKERSRYELHREKRMADARRYRAANKAEVNKRQRIRYQDMKQGRPDVWRAFVTSMTERIKRDRVENPDLHAARSREWRRRRAAAASIAMLILPLENENEP